MARRHPGARNTPAKSCRERPSFDRAGRDAGALLPARCDPLPEMFHVKQPVGVSRSIEDRRPPGAGVVEPGATSAAAAPLLHEARRKEVQTREGLGLRASRRSVTPARSSSRPQVSRETIVAHTPLLGARTRGRLSRATPCLRATHDSGFEISRGPPNPAEQRCPRTGSRVDPDAASAGRCSRRVFHVKHRHRVASDARNTTPPLLHTAGDRPPTLSGC